MANAEIKYKPKYSVGSVSTPVREKNGSRTMTTTVKIQSALVNTNSEYRATAVKYGWKLGTNNKKWKNTAQNNVGISKTTKKFERSINLNSFNGYTRNSYYPYTSTKLTSVSFWAKPTNAKGAGKSISVTRKFEKPVNPSISAFTVTAQNGTVSCTISADPGNGYKERVRTRYQLIIHNTRTGKKWTQSDTAFSGTSHTVSYDVSDYQQLSYAQYVQITVIAWSQGYAGDSDKVSKSYYMAYPAQVTIKSVDVSSRDATGKCTVLINTNNTAQHAVDSVELEYLANSTYKSDGQIPGTESWTSSGIVDDAQCSALAISVQNLIPDPGKYTWLRVKSTHAVPSTLYRYSKPVRVKALETPAQTATDDDIKILSTTLGGDGKSVVVLMGWDVDGTDDSTGTELSWADAEDAWASTEQPRTFEFTWSDGPYTETVSDVSTTYRQSATITIKGLDFGQAVYIRARRYLDADGRSYGDYSNAKTQIPSSAVVFEPEAVALSLPGFVASGKSVLVTWTVSGTNEQQTWQLVTSGGVVIASGEGVSKSYQIPFERLAAYAVNGTVTLTVEVSTGGDPIYPLTSTGTKAYKTVTIVNAPTIAATVSDTLTAQPLSFSLASNMASRIIATITAGGMSGQSPSGNIEQFAGDSVWFADFTPEWMIVSDTSYTYTVTLDGSQEFHDGIDYTLEVIAVDDTTGLQTTATPAEFTVNWAHQAIAPEGCTVTPADFTDINGVHHLQATIGIVAPQDALNTDVYDVYRYTADGAVLIGSGYPSGEQLVDEYAPFGAGMDLFYRIAMRTVDGDEEFADIPYTLNGSVMRFDWPYGVLELPYNIEIGDSYAKDTAKRTHLDGRNNVYWNAGVTRTAKYTSQLVRLESQQDVATVRALARYAGAVFVRTPDGSAYEADVQIGDMSTNGPLQLVSISATEIETTEAFMLPPYEVAPEPEPEEEPES